MAECFTHWVFKVHFNLLVPHLLVLFLGGSRLIVHYLIQRWRLGPPPSLMQSPSAGAFLSITEHLRQFQNGLSIS
ncbi:unnamed protein product [Rhodiola kirilowii]